MVSGFCSIVVGVFLVKFLSLEFAETVGDYAVEPQKGLDWKGVFSHILSHQGLPGIRQIFS